MRNISNENWCVEESHFQIARVKPHFWFVEIFNLDYGKRAMTSDFKMKPRSQYLDAPTSVVPRNFCPQVHIRNSGNSFKRWHTTHFIEVVL